MKQMETDVLIIGAGPANRYLYVMKSLYKLLAICGISWAILIHPFLYFQDIRDQHYRIVKGMAEVSQNLFVKAYATNGIFIVPENYGTAYATRTQQLLALENQRPVIFSAVTWISSAFILVLAVCILKRCKLNHEPN